jgi:2-dehydropantoate 2-reductase
MRVLVMGSGGVGGYIGGMLARAGHDVTFTARGAHLEAIQNNGLTMIDRGESITLDTAKAVRYPKDAEGPFDLVLFTVKTYDTAEAAEAIKPAVGPETVVVPLQNGVDAVDEIGRIVGKDLVLAGLTNIGARIVEPGTVERFSPFCGITVGEPGGGPSERAQKIVAALQEAGLPEAATTEDAQRAVWEKFMLLAPLASLTSAANVSTGKLRAVPEGRDLYHNLLREVHAVGKASGVNLPDESAQSTLNFFLNTLPDTHTTSMQRDYDAQKRVELEHLAGTVIRRGKAVGVPTPGFEVAYAILKTRALQFGGVTEPVPAT